MSLRRRDLGRASLHPFVPSHHQRFGLAYTDFETQRRTPKASFAWYRDLIAAQRTPA